MSDKSSSKSKVPEAPHTRGTSWIFSAILVSFLVSGWFFDAYDNLFTRNAYVVCSESNNIYTVHESKPRVQCISIEDSTIVDTGNLGEITRRRLPATVLQHYLPEWVVKAIRRAPKVFYVAPQAAVVPGLADAHAHVLEYGFMMQLPLATATSVEDVVARIKAYIVAHSDILDDRERWIEGMGWDQTKWPGAKFPTASDLDQDPLLSGRPISLNRVDGHAKWVSLRVLELMGELPDAVDGGNIVRDADGRPTGIFVDNAMALIPTPAWTEERMSDYFDTTMRDALSHGLTSIHDAMSYPDQIRFFKRKADEGKLPNRLYLMGHLPSDDYWGDQIPHLLNYGEHERLTVKSVKLVTDGALGSWGAALLEPYSDKPETSGLMLTPPDELSKLVHQFWKDGFQVNIHCIGDRANHVVLDIFEDMLHDHKTNVTEWRPRIEHAQILTLEDLQRMGKLGVIASVQPTHATSDMTYAEFRLGPERIKGAYAYQTLLQVSPNHILPLGSDFPIESINPLLGFYAAVSRLDTNGSSPHGNGGWFPHERLTRAQALKGMTLDAAYASFAENNLGSLTPGKKADFVVLDRDIMTVPFAEILETKVSATVVDGKVAYGAL